MVEGLFAKRELIDQNDGKVYAMRSILTFGFPLDVPGGRRHDNFLDGREE